VKADRIQPPQALIDRAIEICGEADFVDTYSTVSGIVKPKTRTMQVEAQARLEVLIRVLCYDFGWSPTGQVFTDPHNMQSYLTQEWKTKHPAEWEQYLQRSRDRPIRQ